MNVYDVPLPEKPVTVTGLPLVVVTKMSDAEKPLTGDEKSTPKEYVRSVELSPLFKPSLEKMVSKGVGAGTYTMLYTLEAKFAGLMEPDS